ncbi:MAG: thiamine-phosphate synthase family protein, partial [Methanocellales archaeon]
YADKNWDAILTQIASQLDLNQLEVILDSGGLGLEPLAYIFASTPSQAISKLKEIASQIKIIA